MSENDTHNDDVKEIVKKVYVTNQNYDEYYKALERERKRKEEELRLKSMQSTRLKTPGSKARALMQSEIEEAQKTARSAKECARMLGVSYPTYKKYAKLYGIFENVKNPSGTGIQKHGSGRFINGKSLLERVLEGENPSFPNWKLKKMLVSSGYMPQCCANCGYEEERVTDGKIPLLLDYIDGNRRNHKWENLRMLCYNCWFQINGDLFGKAMRNVKKDAWDYQYIHK
jgi:hypothetical protein